MALLLKQNLKKEIEISYFKVGKIYIQQLNEIQLGKTYFDKLLNEFQSVGFYISDHPLSIYQDFFKESNITTYKDFISGKENNAVVSGTIMSIQEKKSIKGTPFAIVKFSDLKSEFELFLFAEILVQNREKIKESESFVLTLQTHYLSVD